MPMDCLRPLRYTHNEKASEFPGRFPVCHDCMSRYRIVLATVSSISKYKRYSLGEEEEEAWLSM